MAHFSIVTFGCQMNEHDSARMTEILVAAGHQPALSVELAELIVLNTCSVREKAAQKLRSEVGRLALRKRDQKELVIVVAGCLGQQEGAKLLKSVPAIDLVIGPDNVPALPALLVELEMGGPRRAVAEFDLNGPRFLASTPDLQRPAPATYVTVMKGCDERCSFCIVPHTRGSERYRPSDEIIEEIRRLVRCGVREVTLLGQTVNSYRDPKGALESAPLAGRDEWKHTSRTESAADESEFAALLWAIASHVPGLARLRYASPHPRHLTRSLIEAHRGLDILAKHVHLPVQSGNNQILRRMIRRYVREEYLERVEALRSAVPGLTLSTDIIVGFPSETREQFNDTLSLVDEVGFVGLFGFMYSARPYTPALRLGDDVTEDEKAARLETLFARHDPLRQRHLEGLVGSTQQVLIEGRKDDGAYTGRTERNEIVHLAAKADVTGRIVAVRIARAFKNSLAGELQDPSLWVSASELPRLAAADNDDTTPRAESRPRDPLLQSAPAPSKRQLPVL